MVLTNSLVAEYNQINKKLLQQIEVFVRDFYWSDFESKTSYFKAKDLRGVINFLRQYLTNFY